jgi:predicted ATPase/DNA-binding SARP family transcriptional activator
MVRKPIQSLALPQVRLSLFGTFRLERVQASKAERIKLPTRKIESLLAFLVLHPGLHSRERLAAQFWGDMPDQQARQSLRYALAMLRKAVADDLFIADRETIQLNPLFPLQVDALELKAGINQLMKSLGDFDESTSRSSRRSGLSSLDLYRGDLLADFYDDWILPEREEYRQLYLDALLHLTQHYRSASAYTQAVETGQRILRTDPPNERAHQHLMFCYVAQGEFDASLRQYETCCRTLSQELGVEPAFETTALSEWIKQTANGTLSLAARITNLPIPLTSFIGREKEMPEIKRLLTGDERGKTKTSFFPGLPSSRLVTLTGAGGSGKSRLAIQLATDLIDAHRDGVWWVELAALTDGAFVTQAIAHTLGVRESAQQPLAESLTNFLQDKDLLLVIDNCEHLLDICAPLLYALLTQCPQLRILATSREPLGLIGETVRLLPTLAFPDQDAVPLTESLMHYEAIRLFVERARAVDPGFELTPQNAPAVAQICSRLDGIPLALELAAARVKELPMNEIAARLDDRFNFLVRGNRGAPPRQQTLRASITWSYELLSEQERVLFRRLAVFAGGWTLEAAEAVCVNSALEARRLLDLLSHLVQKSLVMADGRGEEPRYRMLETIRHYANAKLLEAHEFEPLRDQHLSFFLKLAEHTEALFRTPQRTEWLPRLEIEHDNLRTALEWACERDLETARWLAGVLERFWFFGDHLGEARTWYARVLNAGDRLTVTKGLALSLFGSGAASLHLEYLDEAQVPLEQSVVLWQKLGDQGRLAWSLAWVAYWLLQRGESAQACALYAEHESLFRSSAGSDVLLWILSNWGTAKAASQRDDPAAKALLEEALSLARAQQDPFQFVLCYSSLGDWAVLQGDYVSARRYFLEALDWRRKLGTRWIIAAGLWQVANIMCIQGDYRQAEPVYTESLALARALGDQRSQAHIGQELGAVALHLKDIKRATTLLAESLAAFRKWADSLGIARCLIGFAGLCKVQGHIVEAAQLLGFVETWLQSNQLQLMHFDRTYYERIVAAASAELDEASLNAARGAGHKMTIEQAIELAM